MSGLNIQGISEAVLAQRTPQTQGEETGTQPTLAEPPNPTVEEGVEPESSSQTNGPPAKATKAATKQKGSKPTTRAAAKLSGFLAQKTQTPGGEASREANLDHEIIVALESPKVAPREHHSGPTQSTASLPQKPGQALAPEGSAYKGRNYIPNYVKPSANKRGN
ncbi:hypothetical protein PtB15_14B7 [Puccinia triticina]|nr:hypothetical protein PtB15_14B7 [Puccinia triticina]